MVAVRLAGLQSSPGMPPITGVTGWRTLLKIDMVLLLTSGLGRSRAHALSSSSRRHLYCRRRMQMDAASKNKFALHSRC